MRVVEGHRDVVEIGMSYRDVREADGRDNCRQVVRRDRALLMRGDRNAGTANNAGPTRLDWHAAEGQRSPTSSDAPKVHRQAFLLLVSSGRSPDAAQIAKVDGIRRAWEPFFFQATEQRMTAITRLR